jgi:hypothetical protein
VFVASSRESTTTASGPPLKISGVGQLCTQVTKKGTGCKRKATKDGKCTQHRDKGTEAQPDGTQPTETPNMPEDTKAWTSASRIAGEEFENLFMSAGCPLCGGRLNKCATNCKSVDFICTAEGCREPYQVKAFKRNGSPKTLKLVGAAYETTLESVRDGKTTYVIYRYIIEEGAYRVVDIYLARPHQITEQCVVRRKALKETAKRAGWVGCYLDFGEPGDYRPPEEWRRNHP